jgi:hypothetical protein
LREQGKSFTDTTTAAAADSYGRTIAFATQQKQLLQQRFDGNNSRRSIFNDTGLISSSSNSFNRWNSAASSAATTLATAVYPQQQQSGPIASVSTMPSKTTLGMITQRMTICLCGHNKYVHSE